MALLVKVMASKFTRVTDMLDTTISAPPKILPLGPIISRLVDPGAKPIICVLSAEIDAILWFAILACEIDIEVMSTGPSVVPDDSSEA